MRPQVGTRCSRRPRQTSAQAPRRHVERGIVARTRGGPSHHGPAAVLWGGCCQAHRRGARLTTVRRGGAAASQGGRSWHGRRAVSEQLPQRQHAARPGRPSRPRRLHARRRPGPCSGGRARQGARPRPPGRRDAVDRRGLGHARKYFSLSEKYAAWADYHTPARGIGIHAYAHTVHRPIRLTDQQLRAHPEWCNFAVG
jgi:hypothetical protein